MDAKLVALYAEEMMRLADTASLAEPLSACEAGFGIEDAYAVSAEVLRRRERAGWRRIGRKIGFTNRTIYEQYDVYAPIFGYMYDRTVVEARTGADGPEATLSLAGLAQPLIEPEIVLKLRSTPPRTDEPRALLSAIEWLAHGFEVVQCHFPGWKFAIADTIADGGLHGRYVIGPAVPVEAFEPDALIDSLASFTIDLRKDGAAVASGGGDLVLGSPLSALAHLVEVLAGLPDHPSLKAGEIVTTGTLTTALPVAPGETWSTRLLGLALPGLTLRFA